VCYLCVLLLLLFMASPREAALVGSGIRLMRLANPTLLCGWPKTNTVAGEAGIGLEDHGSFHRLRASSFQRDQWGVLSIWCGDTDPKMKCAARNLSTRPPKNLGSKSHWMVWGTPPPSIDEQAPQ
jgi:hypothetical protein